MANALRLLGLKEGITIPKVTTEKCLYFSGVTVKLIQFHAVHLAEGVDGVQGNSLRMFSSPTIVEASRYISKSSGAVSDQTVQDKDF